MTTIPFHLLGAWAPGAPAPAISYSASKGHVSVNPVYGCGLGCPFCIGLADPFAERTHGDRRRVHRIASAAGLVDALAREAAALRPLKLSVLDFSDPFVERNGPELRALLSGLNERLPGQAVHLTTRLHPGARTLRWLSTLDRLRLSLFVSLGDATGLVRPVTSVPRRLWLLADARARGLHTVMLLRPLVRQWTRVETLRWLLRKARRHCHEVVVGGLVLTPRIRCSLERAGWPAPARAADEHGGVEGQFLRSVLALAAAELGELPVSEHRSCAVNRHFGLPCQVVSPHALREPDAAPAITACICRNDIRSEAPPITACGCWMDVRPEGGYCDLRKVA